MVRRNLASAAHGDENGSPFGLIVEGRLLFGKRGKHNLQ
jgi:hypothetical protein